MHARMHGWSENIYSIFRDKLLLLGEHIYPFLADYTGPATGADTSGECDLPDQSQRTEHLPALLPAL
jgi:hypothetical protein